MTEQGVKISATGPSASCVLRRTRKTNNGMEADARTSRCGCRVLAATDSDPEGFCEARLAFNAGMSNGYEQGV